MENERISEVLAAIRKGASGRPFDRLNTPVWKSLGNFTARNNGHRTAPLSFIADDLHGLPVIGKFFATVEAYYIGSGYRGRFRASMGAAGGQWKTATFVRTAENEIEQAHIALPPLTKMVMRTASPLHLPAREPHKCNQAILRRNAFRRRGVKQHSRSRWSTFRKAAP